MGTAEKRQKKEVRNYTEGCIPKQLILFALPFMASNAMQVLYSLVDMMVVGKYVGSYGLSLQARFSPLPRCYAWDCPQADRFTSHSWWELIKKT